MIPAEGHIVRDQVRLYYTIKGAGREAIVFLHGFGLNHRTWNDQLEYFSGEYYAIGLDARGHGLSDSPGTNHSREDRVADLETMLNCFELDKVHLVGLSMGGGDALSFAIDHPERLHSLTLAGSVAAGWKSSRRYKDYAALARENGIEIAKEKFKKSVLTYYNKRYPELKDRLGSIIDQFDGKYWLDPMKGKYKVRNDLDYVSTLNIRTLLIIGQHDIFFRSLAEKINQLIPGSILKVIKDAGHMVNMEQPDRFNSVLADFLKEIAQ